VIYEYVLIILFSISLEVRQKNWVRHSLYPNNISSLTIFIKEFLKSWGPRSQGYEDIIHDLTISLLEEGFFSKHVDDL